MTSPTKANLIALGYRMTANATDSVVSRCAEIVYNDYILHYVTAAEVTAASLSDTIGRTWAVLTFLRYTQDVEFGTRTGGEKKRFEYGDHLTWTAAIKNEAARWLAALDAERTVDEEISDTCGVYFKTQLFN